MRSHRRLMALAVVGAVLGIAVARPCLAQQKPKKNPPVSTQGKKHKKKHDDKKKEIVYEYVVTEYNPFTQGVIGSFRYKDAREADRALQRLRRTHWVQWRYAGINEPLRWERFATSFLAQQFIDTDGPSKRGALGFAILTDETKVVASDVRLKKEELTDQPRDGEDRDRDRGPGWDRQRRKDRGNASGGASQGKPKGSIPKFGDRWKTGGPSNGSKNKSGERSISSRSKDKKPSGNKGS